MRSARPLAKSSRLREKAFNGETLRSSDPCRVSAGSISAHCSLRPPGPSAAVTTKGSGHCPVPRRLPSAAASHSSSLGAMLRTSDCATRSITGHVSPPSAIPSVAPDILRCANVVTRTDVLSVVSRTDCLPWHVSFCSDRRCLIRTLANLPHNRALFLQSAPKPRVATVRFLSRLERPFPPFSNPGSFGKFF